MSWPTVRLGDVAEIIMGQAPDGGGYNTDGVGWPLIAGAGDFTEGKVDPKKFTSVSTKLSRSDDIVLSIRASIGAKVWSDGVYCLGRGVAALRASSRIDAHYLWHWVSAHEQVLKAKGRGATFLQVNRSDIAEMSLALPPLPEQRRIASILDQASDALHAASRAISGLDALIASRFVELFEGERFWAQNTVGELLEAPLRNGVSPSTSGKFAGEVLTLSAVTQGRFDSGSRKKALFERPLGGNSIKKGDLLICRGNGNPHLVGRGEIAVESLPDVGFPDTIIAARFRSSQLSPAYVQAVWHRPQIRRQIDAGARTTNGTYKVNQRTLESIEIPVPDLDLQLQFEKLVDETSVVRDRYSLQVDLLTELFASLQHRAFRGGL